MKKNKKRKDIIYSTNSEYEYEYEETEPATLPNNKQILKIHINKHRAGKTTVIIKEFVGTSDDLKKLGQILKTKCGVGGSAKNGEIIIQGDVRARIIEILSKLKYHCKRVGG